MFAYCGNNPVIRKDTSGQGWISALILVGVVGLFALSSSGCSQQRETDLPYSTPEAAAKAFSEEVHSESMYIRHEYITEIYCKDVNGRKSFNYKEPRVGGPHKSTVDLYTPPGTTIVAYAHTHPNDNDFSDKDKQLANGMKINAYVVGPDLNLKRYDYISGVTDPLKLISPVGLSDIRKKELEWGFQVSWDTHMLTCTACEDVIWPTP